MRPFIELKIDNQLVEFNEPPLVLFTYAHNDLHNPTVVKNSFSKTLTVDGTPRNNQIFGCFGEMNRLVAYADGKYLGAHFNPSRKVDFVLLRNSEPIERGYVKLDRVTKKGNILHYEITLYGGIGQFLYNLTYGEDGELLKLSDLEYPYDLNFGVNHQTVRDAWRHINGLSNPQLNPKYDFINFAPAYNGIPQDFSADKVAISTDMYPNVWGDTSASKNEGYSDVNGWILGELPKEYDEWQMRDLRSYLQRPVVRFKEIFKACCNPENNGGYEVDYQDEFFSEENEYFEDAWMTLPLLTEMEQTEAVDITNHPITNDNGNITVDGLETGKNYKVSFSARLGAEVNSTETVLYTASHIMMDGGGGENSDYAAEMNVARYVQLVAYDSSGKIVGGSVVNVLCSDGIGGFKFEPVYKTSYKTTAGCYRRQDDGTYMFDSLVKLDVTVKYEEGMYFRLVEKFATSGMYGNVPEINELHNFFGNISYDVTSWFNDMSDAEIEYRKGLGWMVSKETLLNSEHSPADYFLNYLKMFNLHIWSDNIDKKIYIRQRKNYFNGSKINMDDNVDRGDNIVITPLMFDAKYYVFNNPIESNSYLAKNYKDVYGIDYGVKRVNTNYNFDSSSKELIEHNVFKGAVCQRGYSKYYTDIYLNDWSTNSPVPPFVLDGFKTYLFKEDDSKQHNDITPKPFTNTVDWYSKSKYDLFPKADFRDKDGKPIDGANVLLFYNGKQNLQNVDGDYMGFILSDDLPEFDVLNDGEPCWIMGGITEHSVSVTILPVFTRYTVNENNWVESSWDFGTPKEIYIDGWNIDESSELYNKFWKDYMNDELDINTRLVECKIKFDGRVNPDYLMNFIYFDKCYWKIQEIIDYDITANKPTKCKMVKVNDINNYMS